MMSKQMNPVIGRNGENRMDEATKDMKRQKNITEKLFEQPC